MSHPTRQPPWTPPNPLPGPFKGLGLVIRRYHQSDAARVFEAISLSRENLWPWMPWAKSNYLSLEQTLDSIARFEQSWADPLRPEYNTTSGFIMGVFEESTGDLLGGTGFNRLDPSIHNAETGYWVRADRQRRGIATRILRVGLSMGFTPQSRSGLGFRRVHIFAAAPNVPSCGVPAKLGLRQSLHARLDRWIDGIGYCDTIGWDVLAAEWDAESCRLRE
ncbi:Putative ribosomal N-acetyltransferase YdaF [Phycisphaerales bacterium]|nr:Putative ribosomal N-acetyltransferase YdaF [Phycisphaerales bacterium]